MNHTIIGTWALHSFEIEDRETKARKQWGKNSHGILIYAPTGHMSVSINKDVENDPTQSKAENLFDSILFYAGTFDVSGNVIRHQVTEASNAARVGKEMIRYAKRASDLLELATPEESFGRALLTWKKMG